jgi:hypothetical protein
LPVWIYRKNPVSFAPPQQSETGFLSQSLLPSFDLSKKPGFSQQREQIRNRVFATIFTSQFEFSSKTRFLTATRKNPVSLTLLQAVRRCEIIGGASRFLVATHLTNWLRCVAVRLLVVLPDFWWRRTYE